MEISRVPFERRNTTECPRCDGTGAILVGAQVTRCECERPVTETNWSRVGPKLLAACQRIVYADGLGSVIERQLAIQEAEAAIAEAEGVE